LKALSHTKIAGLIGKLANHQAGRIDFVGFNILRIDANISDVWIGQRHYLAAIGRVGQDLLISGHCGVKHHFSAGTCVGTNGYTPEHRTVSEREYGRTLFRRRQGQPPGNTD